MRRIVINDVIYALGYLAPGEGWYNSEPGWYYGENKTDAVDVGDLDGDTNGPFDTEDEAERDLRFMRG